MPVTGTTSKSTVDKNKANGGAPNYTPEQLASLAKAGVDASTAPTIPTLNSALVTGISGNPVLNPAYAAQSAGDVTAGQLDLKALAANPDALNALKARAMDPGQSAWLKMSLDQQGLGETTAMDQAGGQANSQAALARSQLGMHGGLSAGASERAAANAANQLSLSRQGIGRAGQVDRLNLGIADDQTKTQLLSQIPGMDLAFANQQADLNKFNINAKFDQDKFNTAQQTDINKFNIGNTLGAINQTNQDKLGVYGEQMKGYAAGKTANATAKGGKK